MAAQGLNQEFDYQRKRLAQQENATVQAQKDAIARRQAQAGGGVSGAFQAQERTAVDQSAQRLETGNEQINAAQRAEQRRINEIKEQRDFARSERLGGQEFAAGQAKLGREFATSERLGGQTFQEMMLGRQQTFAKGEREAGQAFATSERLGGQAFQEGMLGKQQAFATSEREAGQTFQEGMLGKQQTFAHDERLGAEAHASALAQAERELKAYAMQLQNTQWNWQFDQALKEFAHQQWVDQQNLVLANKAMGQKDSLETLFGNFSMSNINKAGKSLSFGGPK